MMNKRFKKIIMCLSIAIAVLTTQITFAQPGNPPVCSDPTATPVDPNNNDSACQCPDGSIIAQNGSCSVATPLDTYVWVLLGIGGIYGVMKIRQNKIGFQES